MEQRSDFAIGIDLGTTNSTVAVYQNGHPILIRNSSGSRVTPSYVSYDNGEYEVGEIAKESNFDNPKNTVFAIKRIIGRRYCDEEVKINQTRWPFSIIDNDGTPVIQLTNGQLLKPEDVSAKVLRSLKDTAASFLQGVVTKAVITVPANFNHAQRQATKTAGEMAGLEVIGIINEPTAAAIAYGLQNSTTDQTQIILVFDLGGGTLDVSVIKINDTGTFQAICTDGNDNLGGEDFDHRIYQFLLDIFEKDHGHGIRDDPAALARLRSQAETIKFTLSVVQKTEIALPMLHKGIDFKAKLTREYFNEICADLFAQITQPIDNCLQFANLRKDDIDQVVLVGGSSRIPEVQERLQSYFQGRCLYKNIHPEEAIAMGAAVVAHSIINKSAFPEKFFSDVTAKSLGTVICDGSYCVILPRFSPVPSAVSKVFTTVIDYQINVIIKVYEGDDRRLSRNSLLGQITVSGITSATAGKVLICVTYAYNESAILTVTATEVGSQNGAHLSLSMISHSQPTRE